jgi:hypothetical protein
MSTKTKWIVALAALAVVGLLMAILYIPMLGPKTVRAAAASPLGLAAMSLLMACLLVLGLLAFYLKRCTDRPHAPLHKFFSDEGGTAAFEFLLGMPFILLILLLVLECALLWNANMVIHYAGFAATRAAITTIQSSIPQSADPSDPPDGSGPYLGEANYMVNNPEPFGSPPLPSSLKLARIQRAAAIALTAISDEYPTSECQDWDIPGVRNLPETIATGIQTAIQNAGSSDPNQPWPQHVARQYAYAWANSTTVLTIPYHWQNGDPNSDCPYAHRRNTTWNPTAFGGWNTIPICPGYNDEYDDSALLMDYAWNEPLTVTLTYYFPLEIPYANAVLNKLGLGEPYVIPGSGENSYKLLVTVVTEL